MQFAQVRLVIIIIGGVSACSHSQVIKIEICDGVGRCYDLGVTFF